MKARWYEVIEETKEINTKSGDEIAEDIIAKAGLKFEGEGE